MTPITQKRQQKLYLLLVMFLVVSLTSCSVVRPSSRVKVERDMAKREKAISKAIEKDRKMHYKMQSKATKEMMKDSKKRSKKNNRYKRR